jgi:toxin secretion/phage lysis holin
MSDITIKSIVAFVGAVSTFLLGGSTAALTFLIVLAIIDYISGVAKAWYTGEWKYREGLVGIARKVFMFLIVSVAHFSDTLMSNGSNLVRDAAIYFYIANELLSVIKNVSVLGVSIPPVIKNTIAKFSDKGGGSGG